ncbi:Vms1/Ankzf1 family peptidyl-tRNA hydrolase [Streptomyces sp. NPDC093250]|uniref:baeRF2 domain-containing protein n=1 Tax=unclassified Streptomyces TaxID=2593676 RepID=UPI00340CA8E8
MELAFLHPLYERPGPWASVYVDTSRHTEFTPQERQLTARAMARELADQGADEATCQAVHQAIEELRHSPEPHGRALFARDGEVVLDPALTRSPGGHWAQWERLPRVAPLVELAGEDPVCIVAYIDRRGADFELRSALGRDYAGGVTGRQWPLHRTGSADWSERHFQLKVENTWERNAAEVADALAVCQEETGADLLILVGDERERRSVHERLPKRLQGMAVETPRGPGSRLLDEEVERIREQHVRDRAAEELERFLAARVPDDAGRPAAVEGVPALVEAAREHRIDELLIRTDGPDTHREVFIGEDPDYVAVQPTDLQVLGEQNAWPARADDALLRSAVETGAVAVAVDEVAAEDAPAGGLGALLRWK